MCNIWIAELEVGIELYNHMVVKNFLLNCKEFAELISFSYSKNKILEQGSDIRCGEI